jgi:sec-independent protein translocase protein TatA
MSGMGAMQPTHWLIVIAVLVVLFGAKKLPEAARGLGRSARILKAEVQGLHEDEAPRGTAASGPTAGAPTAIAPATPTPPPSAAAPTPPPSAAAVTPPSAVPTEAKPGPE